MRGGRRDCIIPLMREIPGKADRVDRLGSGKGGIQPGTASVYTCSYMIEPEAWRGTTLASYLLTCTADGGHAVSLCTFRHSNTPFLGESSLSTFSASSLFPSASIALIRW